LKVSSIIRCRNEERWIGYAIQSFLDIFPDGEIIIADNCSSDTSKEIVYLFDYADIKILDIDDYTPGISLNRSVDACSNDIVLVQSAHSVITHVNKDELNKSIRKHAAVFGNQIPVYFGKKITKRYIWSNFIDDSCVNMYSEIEKRYFLHNAFCFYQKDILLKNRFDEKLSGKEDRYWARDIIRKGFTYLYDPINFSCNHHFTLNGATWRGIG